MDKLDSTCAEIPEIFNFSFGHWQCMGELEWDGKQLIHKVMVTVEHGTPLVISHSRWAEFWPAVEKANVWKWAPEYNDNMILDGTQWSLEIKYRGKHVRCEGSNSFPGYDDGQEFDGGFDSECEFGRFLTAVRLLTDGKFRDGF